MLSRFIIAVCCFVPPAVAGVIPVSGSGTFNWDTFDQGGGWMANFSGSNGVDSLSFGGGGFTRYFGGIPPFPSSGVLIIDGTTYSIPFYSVTFSLSFGTGTVTVSRLGTVVLVQDLIGYAFTTSDTVITQFGAPFESGTFSIIGQAPTPEPAAWLLIIAALACARLLSNLAAGRARN